MHRRGKAPLQGVPRRPTGPGKDTNRGRSECGSGYLEHSQRQHPIRSIAVRVRPPRNGWPRYSYCRCDERGPAPGAAGSRPLPGPRSQDAGRCARSCSRIPRALRRKLAACTWSREVSLGSTDEGTSRPARLIPHGTGCAESRHLHLSDRQYHQQADILVPGIHRDGFPGSRSHRRDEPWQV